MKSVTDQLACEIVPSIVAKLCYGVSYCILKVIYFEFAWKVITVCFYFKFVFKKVKTTNVTQKIPPLRHKTYKQIWLLFPHNLILNSSKNYFCVFAWIKGQRGENKGFSHWLSHFSSSYLYLQKAGPLLTVSKVICEINSTAFFIRLNHYMTYSF